MAQVDLAQVVAEAMRLSSLSTLAGGHRSFDILHVATASVLKTKRFLAFDGNQGKLAASAGLAVGPQTEEINPACLSPVFLSAAQNRAAQNPPWRRRQ